MDAPVDVDTANADALFPLPSLHPPSSLCPTLQLGVSAASRETVRRVLRESHYRWHLYLNDEGFHKWVSSSPRASPNNAQLSER